MLRHCLCFIALSAASLASAQEVPVDAEPGIEAPVELVAAGLLGAYGSEVEDAAVAWSESWADVPTLVSLRSDDDVSTADEALEARLSALGEKVYSNREWRSYWERQGATMATLMEAVQASDSASSVLTPMQRWVDLAAAKVVNQDAYFEAIEMERDALEARLEASITAEGDDDDAVDVISEDPTPYERRSLRMGELESDMAAQHAKRTEAEAEVAYIQQILSAKEVLGTALETDLLLAQTELDIAKSLANTVDPWGELWGTIVTRTEAKVEKIRSEVEYGKMRRRGREVELGLTQSKIAFRDSRLATLQEAYDKEASLNSWLSATWATVLVWLRSELWRILLGLGAVYIGVRVAKRFLRRATTYVVHRADDDVDVDDGGDQRRTTLAEVFIGVATITIYVIGALLALEQIGVNTAPLLGSVAILGLAISFGSQNLVRDVVNGFFILLENQYAVGDIVKINGETGTVERITIRSTWVRSYNGDLHTMPNGGISLVSNLTRGWSRTIVEIGVSYDADIDVVERISNEVGQAMFADADWKSRLEEAPVFVGVVALADSSVNVRLHVRVEPGDQWAAQRELFRRMKVALDAEGIEIPYPQRVIHQAAQATDS
jgi:small conductance mechanosensitive channel